MEKSSSRVVIALDMSFPELAETILEVLRPELKVSWAKSRAQISVEETVLTLSFTAKNTSTLRTLINSYLRWIIMIKEVIAVLNQTNLHF